MAGCLPEMPESEGSSLISCAWDWGAPRPRIQVRHPIRTIVTEQRRTGKPENIDIACIAVPSLFDVGRIKFAEVANRPMTHTRWIGREIINMTVRTAEVTAAGRA
jgi:hypothetical protein